MPIVEIYFAGLICHVGPSEKEGSDRTTLARSILIADGDYHVPRILTSASEPGSQDGGADVLYTYFGEKLHTNVSFINLGMIAKPLGLFQDSVPHLDDLTRSGVSFSGNPSGITVQLAAGTFTVVAFYDTGAKWTLDDDVVTRQCVPRITMLRASGDDVAASFNGQELPLGEDGGWVLITNLEYRQTINYAEGDDWKKQHAVTTGDRYDIATYEALAPAGTVTCYKKPPAGKYTKDILDIFAKSKLIDTSECTNTHWP